MYEISCKVYCNSMKILGLNLGNDIEMFKTKYLEMALKMMLTNFQKEHISPFFLKFANNIYLIKNKKPR